MPCDLNLDRLVQADIQRALKRLESSLENGSVTIVIGSEGSVAFQNWESGERSGLSDLCAYRRLMVENSFSLRLAVQRAETMAGRRVNESAVAAGVHSHDGGGTWSTH